MWTFNKKFEVVDDDTSFKCQNKYESVSEILEVTRKGQCCLGDSWGIDTEKKEVNAKKKKSLKVANLDVLSIKGIKNWIKVMS